MIVQVLWENVYWYLSHDSVKIICENKKYNLDWSRLWQYTCTVKKNLICVILVHYLFHRDLYFYCLEFFPHTLCTMQSDIPSKWSQNFSPRALLDLDRFPCPNIYKQNFKCIAINYYCLMALTFIIQYHDRFTFSAYGQYIGNSYSYH